MIDEVKISPPLQNSPEELLTIIQTQELRSIATIETPKGTLGIIVLNEDA